MCAHCYLNVRSTHFRIKKITRYINPVLLQIYKNIVYPNIGIFSDIILSVNKDLALFEIDTLLQNLDRSYRTDSDLKKTIAIPIPVRKCVRITCWISRTFFCLQSTFFFSFHGRWRIRSRNIRDGKRSATQKFPRSAAVLAAMQDLRANLPTHWPIAAVP